MRAAAGARAAPAVPTGTLTLATAAVRAPAQVAVPTVLPQERMLFSRAGLPGIYRAVLRFGYLDRVDLGPDFVAAVVHEARGPAACARAPAPFKPPPVPGAAAAAVPHTRSALELCRPESNCLLPLRSCARCLAWTFASGHARA